MSSSLCVLERNFRKKVRLNDRFIRQITWTTFKFTLKTIFLFSLPHAYHRNQTEVKFIRIIAEFTFFVHNSTKKKL